MTDKAPQILPEKPGEPGGEKARERQAVLQGLRSTTQIWLTKEDGGPGTQYLTDVLALIDEALSGAGALAACALAEAKWWEHLVANEEHDIHLPCPEDCMYCARIASLERAAEDKA